MSPSLLLATVVVNSRPAQDVLVALASPELRDSDFSAGVDSVCCVLKGMDPEFEDCSSSSGHSASEGISNFDPL